MKPIDILDALSDLPEEYAEFAVRKEASRSASEKKAKSQISQGGILMKKMKSNEKAASVRISRAGVAAAVAVCIGLNAALIFGISRMNRDSGTFTPAAAPSVQEEIPANDKVSMQLFEGFDPLPTGITVQVPDMTLEVHNALNPQFIVTQNGEKVADCELSNDSFAQGANCQELCFDRLPAGSYTLVNLAEDGASEGILGHLDFEISDIFDDMIYIPRVDGMNYDKAKALLEEKGVNVDKKGVVSAESNLNVDDVVTMEYPAYKTETNENGDEVKYFYADSKGCWVNTGDTVTLQVNLGNDGEPQHVPYLVGQDFETAKYELLNRGFYVDKRSVYSDDIPAGAVAAETVEDIAVPEEGMEAAVGSYVRITVSLGVNPEHEAAAEETTDIQE
ncbi:MAG: PASTA domain-containing protein [Oscillospiraceae bacterium]|nr:PASTA domain-containing protein [Oscillospiraceae bacterium]